eukprot:scaffold5660_cov323-Prasinococcus_capsulatus_cf.AAC.3
MGVPARRTQGRDLGECRQLSKKARAQLAEGGARTGRSVVYYEQRAPDDTTKYLLRLRDQRVIETVGIPSGIGSAGPASERLTVCVSSQVGCPMRCTFCATGKGGYARHLRAHEIVDQVLTVQERFGTRVSNVVFMGMGEPLLNLHSVVRAFRCLNQDLGIGARSITISTVGVPNAIRRLAEHKLQATLAVSLHAPNQTLRERLVPSAKVYPIGALLDDCLLYFDATGRRVSFEYTLIRGVNDAPEHAHELAALLGRHGLGGHHVNVIPYNPVDDAPDYQRPSAAGVRRFVRELEGGAARLTATVRVTRGLEASAACGQLRNSFQKQPLP